MDTIQTISSAAVAAPTAAASIGEPAPLTALPTAADLAAARIALCDAETRFAAAEQSSLDCLARSTGLWTKAAFLVSAGRTGELAAVQKDAAAADAALTRAEKAAADAKAAVRNFRRRAVAIESLLWVDYSGVHPSFGLGVFGGVVAGAAGEESASDAAAAGEWAFLQPQTQAPEPADPELVRTSFREQVHLAAAAAGVSRSTSAGSSRASSAAAAAPSVAAASTGSTSSASSLSSASATRTSLKDMVWKAASEAKAREAEEAARAAEAAREPEIPWWDTEDGDDYWTDDEIFIPTFRPRRRQSPVRIPDWVVGRAR
jgi:hypothetical protein